MSEHQRSQESKNRDDSPVVVVEPLVIGDLLTEPMSKQEIARNFNIGRKKVAAIIPHLDAEKIGDCYRIPLRKMPVAYLKSLNLI